MTEQAIITTDLIKNKIKHCELIQKAVCHRNRGLWNSITDNMIELYRALIIITGRGIS